MKVVRSLIFGWSPIRIQDYLTSEMMKFGVPEHLARSIIKVLADAGYLQSEKTQPPLVLTQEFRVPLKTKDKKLMDVMKRLTVKKKRIEIRLKGRPDSGI